MEPEESFYSEMSFIEPCSEPVESALYHVSFLEIFKITIHTTPPPPMSSSLTNQSNLWNVVLLEKLIVAQLFSKHPTLYGGQKFATVFIKAHEGPV